MARWALDWGYQAITLPVVVVNPDLGTFVGGVGTRQYFGYRKFPFASSHAFDLGLALPQLKASASYTGTFRRLLRDLDATVRVQYSGLQVIRFNGWGNQTEILEPASFYESRANLLVFGPGPGVSRREAKRAGGPRIAFFRMDAFPGADCPVRKVCRDVPPNTPTGWVRLVSLAPTAKSSLTRATTPAIPLEGFYSAWPAGSIRALGMWRRPLAT